MAAPTSLLSSDFLEHLRLQGFEIGIDHYRRLHILLAEVGADLEPERLKTYLCPLFASNPAQQKAFYETFDRFHRSWSFQSEPAASGPAAALAAPTSLTNARSRTSQRRRIELALLALVAVALIAIVWSGQRTGSRVRPRAGARTVTMSNPGAAPKPVGTATPPASLPLQPTTATPAFPAGRRWTGSLRWIAIVAPLVVFVIAEIVQRRRRKLILRQTRARRPPFAWSISAPSVVNPYALSSELRETTLVLRAREPSEVEQLALEPSIAATIAARGFPTLRYAKVTRPAEYLFLIERTSFRDHQTRLFSDLAAGLRREGVHVDSYAYDGDPRICHPLGDGEPVLLANLRRSHPAHRLIILGGGERLIDPVDGLLAVWTELFRGWPDRAILTPEPVERWTVRERVLATEFIVLPASIDGLRAAVTIFRTPAYEDFSQPARNRVLPAHVEPATAVEQLRSYLGPRGFRWLCACAVYPELHWELTLNLATLPSVGEGMIAEESLLRLIRLPWFRAGSIPDEIRAVLVDQLDAREMTTVRETLLRLLERQALPSGSLAAEQHGLDLAVQRYAIAPQVRSTRHELRRALERSAGKGDISDYAVVQLLDKVPQSRLVMQLPHRWRKALFSGGVPALGWTTVSRLMLAVTMSIVLAALLMTRLILRSSVTPATIAASTPRAELPRTPAIVPERSDSADTIGRGVDEHTAIRPHNAAVTSPRSRDTVKRSRVAEAPPPSTRSASPSAVAESVAQVPVVPPAAVAPSSEDTVTRKDSAASPSREDSIRSASRDTAVEVDSSRVAAETVKAASAARAQMRTAVNDYLRALTSRDTGRVATLYHTRNASDERVKKSLLDLMRAQQARMAVVDQHVDTIEVRDADGWADFTAKLTWRTAFGASRSEWVGFHAGFQPSDRGWVMISCTVTGGLR